MPKIVIDTNIGFSALLNINGSIGQILIEGDKFFEFYAPEYFKVEIYKTKRKSKLLQN